jgi:methionyl-tRNA formyltransferase
VERRGLKISILVDDPSSWIMPWAWKLLEILSDHHEVCLVHDSADLTAGDMAFFLGCTKIVPAVDLKKNNLNLVVHESDLPKGRGFSPVAWQVASGENVIPVVLFEAVEAMDAGPIYLKDAIELDGTELLPELREKQGAKTVDMFLRFLERWPEIKPRPQQGEESVYRRRNREDDRLDTEKSLEEIFDRLRIVDNERYPAWFELRGRRYILKIYPDEN